MAGEYVARAFFSKNWQLRDAAVAYLTKEVRGLASSAAQRSATHDSFLMTGNGRAG